MDGGVGAGADAESTGSNRRNMRRNSPCPMRASVWAWAEPAGGVGCRGAERVPDELAPATAPAG